MTALPPDADVRARAIDPNISAIVQAPAGSGKTSLLVARYLRLLGNVSQPEEILAITFTVKAAQEMRDRVNHALLRGETAEARTALARSDERGWALRDNPARLRIQTIDGFAAGIVNRLPNLSNSRTWVPVEDPSELYQQASERVLHDALGDLPHTPAINRLLSLYEHDARRMQGMLERMLATRDHWMPAVTSAIAHEAQSADEGLQTMLNGALEVLHAQYQERLASAASGALSETLDACFEAFEFTGIDRLARLADLVLTTRGSYRKRFSPSPHQALLVSAVDLLAETIDASFLDECRTLPRLPLEADETAHLIDVGIVLIAAVSTLRSIFEEQGQTDFLALMEGAQQALRDIDGPTELALALDYRIGHILVDEFQDTSIAQLELFALLTEGWHPESRESFFAVGDPMQSIYRFRNADAARFTDVQRHGIAGLPLENLALTSNFRSATDLVRWNNALFSQLSAHSSLTDNTASYFQQATPQIDAAGEVTTRHFADLTLEAAHLAQQLRAWQSRADGSTCAVLLRSRTHAPWLLHALNTASVDWYGTDIDALSDVPSVMDLQAVLSLLTDPRDRTAWYTVLRAPFSGAPLTILQTLAGCENLVGELQNLQAPNVQRVYRAISSARRQLANKPLREVLEGLLLQLGAYAAYDPSEQAAMAHALDLFDRPDARPFDPSWVAAALDRAYAPSPTQIGVEVLTIHRAKGLEWDHVYLPFANKEPRAGEQPLLAWQRLGGHLLMGLKGRAIYPWLNRHDKQADKQEVARLLYVACTRAKRTLSISHSSGEKIGNNSFARLIDPLVEFEDVANLPEPARHSDPAVLSRIPEDYRFSPVTVPSPPSWPERRPRQPLDFGIAPAEALHILQSPALEPADRAGRTLPTDLRWLCEGMTRELCFDVHIATEAATLVLTVHRSFVSEEQLQWLILADAEATTAPPTETLAQLVQLAPSWAPIAGESLCLWLYDFASGQLLEKRYPTETT